jgi:1-acyl-sn-glycerol-3-phosphate acyltransferase
MLVVRTGFFFLGWTLVTLAMGIAALPLLLMPQRWIWSFNGAWAGFTLWWARVTCGIHSRIIGTPQGQLIASKHQSAWDTLMLWRIFKNPVFVLKRELYLVPVFGWYLWKSGQIAINRSDGRSAFEQIERQAPRLLEQGRSMIIFPEGTRVPVGQKKPFRTGIARVSARLGLPVVPVALNAGLYWPKRPLIKRPGTAALKFLAPMPVCDDDMSGWMAQLETAIETESAALAAGAEQLPVA